jgi:hypothetical protein
MDPFGAYWKRDPVQDGARGYDDRVRAAEQQLVRPVEGRPPATRDRGSPPGRRRVVCSQGWSGDAQAAGVEAEADPDRRHRKAVRLGVCMQIRVVRLDQGQPQPPGRQHPEQADRSGGVHVDDVRAEDRDLGQRAGRRRAPEQPRRETQLGDAERNGPQAQQPRIVTLVGMARHHGHRLVALLAERLDQRPDRRNHAVATREVGVREVGDPHTRQGSKTPINPRLPTRVRLVKTGCELAGSTARSSARSTTATGRRLVP